MPQQFLHHLELRADAPQQSRIGVSEGVPTEVLLNAQFLCLWQYELSHDCLAPIWLAPAVAPARKHPIIRFAVRLLFSPLNEGIRDERMKWDRLLRRFRLAWPDNPTDNRARYIDCLFVKVHVAPLQAKQLTLAQSGRCGKQHERLFTKGQTIHQNLDFIRCEDVRRSFTLCSLTN
jgi:hypothetical protein